MISTHRNNAIKFAHADPWTVRRAEKKLRALATCWAAGNLSNFELGDMLIEEYTRYHAGFMFNSGNLRSLADTGNRSIYRYRIRVRSASKENIMRNKAMFMGKGCQKLRWFCTRYNLIGIRFVNASQDDRSIFGYDVMYIVSDNQVSALQAIAELMGQMRHFNLHIENDGVDNPDIYTPML
jgi:hypothetical protein